VLKHDKWYKPHKMMKGEGDAVTVISLKKRENAASLTYWLSQIKKQRRRNQQ
jgi:hypothetical protein